MSINYRELNKKGVPEYFAINRFGISSFVLKMIALVTMVIDHVGVMFVDRWSDYYEIFRMVGRLSFPIYAFLIVEGFFHTSDRKKYAVRLGAFALISEIPYDMAFRAKFFETGAQNIYFTLLLGLLAIWALYIIENGKIKYPEKLLKEIGYSGLQSVARIAVMLGFCGLGYLIKCSYSYAGIFIIMCFYVFYEHHLGKAFVNAFFNIGLYGGLQSVGTLSAIPIALYNGNPGKRKWKWFFYLVYPVHLLILSLIKYL